MYQPFTRHTRQFHDASRARSAPGKLARIGSVLGMLSLTAATSVVLQQEAKPLVASAVTPLSAVTDVNPNSLSSGTLFGGRTVNFAVNPINTQIVFAATEYGGLWRSVDHGSSWSHVDQVPLTAMQDVKFGSSDANLVIASGAYDGSIDNRGGGIWRSTDGGNNWAKAPGSDVCATLAQNNGKEIAIASGNPGSLSVFVGMDCGIAKSTDSGASWSLVNPPGNNQIWDVKARSAGGNIQVDACGNGGYVRSLDGGNTWPTRTDYSAATFPHPILGNPPAATNPYDPCRVATAPQDSNTVFMTTRSPVVNPGDKIVETYQFESDDGGVNWRNLNVSSDGNGRNPSVLTFPAYDGVPSHFEVYFLTDQMVVHQQCDTNNVPRCSDGTGANTSAPCCTGTDSGNWKIYDASIEAVHYATDPGDLAFDPGTGCPFLEGGDGGVFKTTDGCNDRAPFTDANAGLHALWLYQLAGSAVPGGSPYNAAPHTDIYYGMQDNGQVCSTNDATTFSSCGGADVFNTISDLTGPPTSILTNSDGGFGRQNEDGSGASWTSPTGTIDGAAQFGNQSYALLTDDGAKPPTYRVQVTTNAGSSWAQMGPTFTTAPASLPNGEQAIKASGTAASPVFYLDLNNGATPTIYRLQGQLNNTATLTSASNGLSSAYTFAVDPSNPLRLYAVDSGGTPTTKSSTDGGQSWTADTALKSLTTMGGIYPINTAFGINVNSFGFDPASNTVLVGTQFSGIFASPDGGAHWSPIPGSRQIPRVLGFFFDTRNPGTIYVGSQGRGAWRINLPSADLSITKTASPNPVVAGNQITYTLTATNSSGSASTALGVTVADVLPSQVTYLTSSGSCLQAPVGTLSCQVPDLAPGGTFQFTVTGLVNPNTVVGSGGAVTIGNTATVSSALVTDPNPANNAATVTTTVVDSADLGTTKLCKPDTTIYEGQVINCTVFVDNYGPSWARNVVVDDATLSNGSFVFSNLAVNGGLNSCAVLPLGGGQGQDLQCAVGDLANRSTTNTGRVTVTYTLTPTSTTSNGQNIDNTASVRSDTPDPNPANNSATVNLSVTAVADLALTMPAPGPVVAGNSITWTLGVHNNGPSDSANTVIKDTVPAGVTTASVSMPGATCTSGVAGDPLQSATCQLGTLATGATSTTMTIVASVNPRTTGALLNNASVTSTTVDPNMSNNLASTNTAVQVVASIAVAIAATPNPATAGTPLSYQLTVSNGGPSTATAVTLANQLPSGVAFTSTGGAGTCGFQTNVNLVTCQLPNLDPGQSEVVYVYTGVKASTLPGLITDSAIASAASSPDGTSTLMTLVQTRADLGIVLSSDATTYKPSTTIHYNITVTNAGPSDAQNVTVTQFLPMVKQGKYISNSLLLCPPPSGTTLTCSYTTVPLLVTIPSGGSVSFQVNFYITGNKQTITSSANVASTTSDPNTTNNSSIRSVTVK
jgi:uncharacterized repeat protein (TIGR01451 family)